MKALETAANNGSHGAAEWLYLEYGIYGHRDVGTVEVLTHWRERADALEAKYRVEAATEWERAKEFVAAREFGLALPHFHAAEEYAEGIVHDLTPERIDFNTDMAACLWAVRHDQPALAMALRAANRASEVLPVEDARRKRAVALLAEIQASVKPE